MVLHHYGFATSNIEKSEKTFALLNYKRLGEIVFDPVQKVKILFLQNDKDPLLELIEPVDSEAPVYKILSKNGSTLYHSCYETDDIQESIEILKKEKFVLLFKPVKRSEE